MSSLVQIGFKADSSQLVTADKRLNKLTKTGASADKKISALGKSFAAIGTAIASSAMISKLTAVTRQFDILNAQLITSTGSAEGAAQAFEALQKFAATTPYSLAQATEGFSKLVNLGLTPSEKAMESYGNTASAMGKSLSQMVEAVADAATGEFERLKEFGIKASSQGDQVSFTFRGITQTVKKEAASIEKYLMAIGQNEFAGAMAERSKTLDGAISNLGDSWDALFLTISKQGIGSLIEKGVRQAANAIETLIKWIDSGAIAERVGAVFGTFKDLGREVAFSFNLATQVIANNTQGWHDSITTFAENAWTTLTRLPQMARFAIQAMAVEIASLVDYAKIYGDAFVKVLGLRFDRLVDKAQIDGKMLANALNPFSDDYDSAADYAAMNDKYAQAEALVFDNAQKLIEAREQVKNKMIVSFAEEVEVATDAYQKRIDKSNELIAQYEKEKAAGNGAKDALAEFKIEPDKAILEHMDKMNEKAEDLKETLSGADMFNTIADSAKDSLAAVQGLSAQGSKEYQKLGIAIQAVSAAQAIFAVLNQGSGDPYSAFGRMAAMAGAVASLGVSVGNFSAGSGFDENIAAEMQANQGLDSWGDKSESITNATEMTADATDKLVGINTNMLKALQTMQQDISSAAALSLRGGLVDYPDVSGKIIGNMYDMGSITGNAFVKEIDNSLKLLDFTTSLGVTGALTKFMGKTLGGSSKNVDQGLFFEGGQLGDLREMTNVFSYATTQYRKWRWGSKKTAETYEEMSEAGAQFALVFDSLANTVFEGASTLGVSSLEIENAINRFEIESQKISLKGLDAEAQQKEIENVFSSIFDGLAGSVVPFVEEFQQVGEGLGETLIRLATEVSILDMMSEQLGATFGDKLADPQMYAAIADNLTTLTGGIEGFAESLSGFIDNFAPDAVKFDIVSDAFSKAMNEVGLGVPETAEGFWQLMQSIDGTTEAGQEQMAAILNSQELARDYFDMLEDSSSKLKATAESMRNIITGVYGVSEKIKAQNVDDALMQARRGNFELADKLSNVVPLSSSFTSSAAFKSEQAITANKLAEIADLADGQSTVEMMTLDINKEQRDLLASINDNMRANYNNGANNDTMNEELNMMRAELEELKFANQGIAQSTADSAESLDRLVRDGIEVRTA